MPSIPTDPSLDGVSKAEAEETAPPSIGIAAGCVGVAGGDGKGEGGGDGKGEGEGGGMYGGGHGDSPPRI